MPRGKLVCLILQLLRDFTEATDAACLVCASLNLSSSVIEVSWAAVASDTRPHKNGRHAGVK